MTVSTINSVAEFVTNGATKTFPFYFKFLENKDLVVTYISPDGVSTILAMGTHYTVSGAGNDKGGSVTTTAALAGPGQLIVSRDMEAYQKTSLRNQGKFLAETHEDVFDRLTMLVQQGFAIFKRALTRPFGRGYFYAEGRRIADVANPESDQDAATKGYADGVATGVAERATSYTDWQILRTVRSADGEELIQLPPASSRANKVMGFDAFGQPISLLPASGSGTELAISLADSKDPKKGGGMLGLTPLDSSVIGRTVGEAIRGLQLYQEYGAARFDSNAVRSLTKEAELEPQGIAGGVFSINNPLSKVSLIDFANFAGQGLTANIPNGVVIHHYTDGTLLRLDNVGAGATIRSHMSRNPSRRPDKPADYIGTGNHLHFTSEAGSLFNFFMTPALDMVWQNKGSSFISGAKSSEGGGFCHTFAGYGYQPLHTAFMASANRMLYLGEHAANGRAQITSERALGLEIRAENGLLRLKTLSGGSVILNNGTEGYIQGQGAGKTKIEGGTEDKTVAILGPLEIKRYPTIDSIPVYQTPNDRAVVWVDDVAMVVYWNSVRWVDARGYTPGRHSGTTAQRPVGLVISPASPDAGYDYFDTTLGKPVWWKGAGWVDAAGSAS